MMRRTKVCQMWKYDLQLACGLTNFLSNHTETPKLERLELKTAKQQESDLAEAKGQIVQLQEELAGLKETVAELQDRHKFTSDEYKTMIERNYVNEEKLSIERELCNEKQVEIDHLIAKITTLELFQQKLAKCTFTHVYLSRDISNNNVGDPERGNYGLVRVDMSKSIRFRDSDGSISGYCVAEAYNSEDELVFQANWPDEEDTPEKHMYLARTSSNAFTWNAYDTSRYQSEDTMLRRFTLNFTGSTGGAQMIAMLTFGFGGNCEIITDFMTPGSRFYKSEDTLPPRFIPDINRMVVDGEEDIPHDEVPLDESLEEEMYGDVVDYQTQTY